MLLTYIYPFRIYVNTKLSPKRDKGILTDARVAKFENQRRSIKPFHYNWFYPQRSVLEPFMTLKWLTNAKSIRYFFKVKRNASALSSPRHPQPDAKALVRRGPPHPLQSFFGPPSWKDGWGSVKLRLPEVAWLFRRKSRGSLNGLLAETKDGDCALHDPPVRIHGHIGVISSGHGM
jgi:hypothetical protein